MKTKLFGILTFVMIALAGTVIAYGHWYSSATVNATITTGYLDIALSNDTPYPNILQCSECPDVVTAQQSLSSDGSTLSITIDNAYPGVFVWGIFNIANIGTVPAEMAPGSPSFTVTDNDSPPGDIIILPGLNDTSAYINDDGYNMMLISWTFTNADGTPVTSDTLCPQDTVYVHWGILFLEPLEQATIFSITSTWTFQNCEPVAVDEAPS